LNDSSAISSPDQCLFSQKRQFPLHGHRLPRQKPSSPCLIAFAPFLNYPFAAMTGVRWVSMA
jgi:hypothetical protein